MKKRKPRIIRDPKVRGEWVESVFMARASEHGLAVSKPWGDSRSYDFVIGRPGRFVGVQVKSTVCRSGGGYECCIRGKGNKAYRRGSFDFLAAYVVVKDAWYIIPAGAVEGKETVCLFSKSKYARYEGYREAWQLLREAPDGEAAEGESCAEDSAGAESAGDQRPPVSAAGRMEAAMNYFRQRLERGGVDPQKR
jgi:PD-(D/E)XK nuclease superfamily protein